MQEDDLRSSGEEDGDSGDLSQSESFLDFLKNQVDVQCKAMVVQSKEDMEQYVTGKIKKVMRQVDTNMSRMRSQLSTEMQRILNEMEPKMQAAGER